MSIVTKGYGKGSKIITQGYGTLVIIVEPEAPSVISRVTAGGYAFHPEPGLIQTRTIKLPTYKEKIEVDVLLINKEDFKHINVILERMKQEYEKIEVYVIEDVEYD